MTEVIHGRADSIRIEPPGINGAEFYLRRGLIREHWQAKRHLLSQENWSLQKLKSEGVLDFFLGCVRGGEFCVFASISEAPELRVLCENAADADDLNEFEREFLKSRDRQNDFEALKKHLGGIPDPDVFSFLRSLRVEGARECTLEKLLLVILGLSFSSQPETSLSVLRDLYLTQVHKTLDAPDILAHLRSQRIEPRRLEVSAGLTKMLKSVVDAYASGQRGKLIRGSPIQQELVGEWMTRLTSGTGSVDLLVTGAAGGGKSAALLQLVEGLRAASVPVLAFRLDRIEPVVSTVLLGQKLGLPESPAVTLARCFPDQPVVLVVDQLDCVSTTSGRHPDFFDVVASLCDEVRGLRAFGRVHLVMSCRRFDYEHDHRFRQLIPQEIAPVELTLFPEEVVKKVVMAEGGKPEELSIRQIELLRLPQNLALFVDAKIAAQGSFGFATQKHLFDAYWNAKRQEVGRRRPESSGQWLPLLKRLTDLVSERQDLSVGSTALDEFSPDLLGTMVSEGVLTLDRGRYGFGHESFFDYCFARITSTGEADFVESLESDSQHLFRRGQLRQVLVYLRESDPQKYLQSVKRALGSPNIRAHLKLLILELLAAMSDVNEAEWALWIPLLESELASRMKQEINPDKISSRAFDVFFFSRDLFVVADRSGMVATWISSASPVTVELAIRYLRLQAGWHPGRVAELLEPFVELDGDWPARLRFVMSSGNQEKDRRFFELFLRLLERGILDDPIDSPRSNDSFWLRIDGLAKHRPTWCAELAARWLDRQVVRAKNSGSGFGMPYRFLNDDFGVESLFESVRLAPVDFLGFVLPPILAAATSFSRNTGARLIRDDIWEFRHHGEHIGLREAYPAACELAFDLIGNDSPQRLRSHVEVLTKSKLHTANHLLLKAYLSAPKFFADHAMALLAAEPERLRSGYADSPFWVSRCLVEKCSPICADSIFRALENAVLKYESPYERTEEGAHLRGNAAFNLASSLDPSRISQATNEQLAAWRSRFGEPDGPPRGIRSYTVVSPVPEEDAKKMTDEQWLEAIKRFDGPRRDIWKNPEIGGADQLAAMLKGFVEREPERFALLALSLPAETQPTYLRNVLYGLRNAKIAGRLKLEVARRRFNTDSVGDLKAVLDVLRGIDDEILPEDAIHFIEAMAVHPDPQADEWRDDRPGRGNDIITHGINTVRGEVAGVIRDLIFDHESYLKTFSQSIERLVRDPVVSVRSCVATTLAAVALHDAPRAVSLFTELVKTDDDLLKTQYVVDFMAKGLSKHLADFRPHILRMLASTVDEVRRQGGILACLACLHHPSADDLASAAVEGDRWTRLGASDVAKTNLTHPECREWCERALIRFFEDEDSEVRKTAADCFRHFWRKTDEPLSTYELVTRSFVSSKAFEDEPTYMLHALEETRQQVPEMTLDVCEAFVDKCSSIARDIRTSIAADERIVGKLVFRSYAQLGNPILKARALGLIDRMCEEGLQSARSHLDAFDR